MKAVLKNPMLPLALAASLAWSPASQACANEPVLSSVCVMAAINLADFNNTYAVADGRMLSVNQNTALFSLLGAAYGGDGRTTFALPDLRGRMIVGAGQGPGLPQYNPGNKGGQTAITLTITQLPTHTHTLVNASVDISKLTANTTLSGLSGSLAGTAKLMGSNTTGTLTTPEGNTLGGAPTLGGRIYTSAAPAVQMNAASIDTSGLTVSVTGNPTTTLGGSATVAGATGPTGAGQQVPIMPPYLAMTYYIATVGIYPSRN